LGDLLLVIGTAGLIVVAVSLALEFRAWRRLDESTKSQQRAIKAADLAVHAAERGHQKQVKAAEREVFRAENPPPHRSFGRLELFDDRVRCGGQVFPLSNKTRPRVKCRGRGDKRSVTVLLEDPNWSQSLNATKIGKEHELEAEKFASDVRVFAPTAAEARARSLAALTQARRTAESIASNTSEVDVARRARAQLGDRLKASGHPPGQRWRRAATPAAVVALLVGGIANTPPEEQPATAAADTPPASTSTPIATPTATPVPRGEMLDRARGLLNRGDYVGAQAAVSDLPAEDRSDIRRLASDRAARVVENALRRSDRSAARRALERASGLPHTPTLDAARDHYQSAIEVASAERRTRQAEARTEKAAAAANARAAAEADYAGMTCAEIGQPFQVTPGSDPEHDSDGDGSACESQ
jgi:hypothetical protein